MIMRYTITKNIVQIIGKIWMPSATCGDEITLSEYDMKNATNQDGTIDRESVEQWLMLHSGDFSYVIDFRADLEINGETVIFDWNSNDSELIFHDCMFSE